MLGACFWFMGYLYVIENNAGEVAFVPALSFPIVEMCPTN
jgi:hypothetical protein